MTEVLLGKNRSYKCIVDAGSGSAINKVNP